MSRHKGFEWAKVLAKVEAENDKLWSLNKGKKRVVNPMLLLLIKKPASTFSLIAWQKVQKFAEAFVTIVKHMKQRI